jgi:2-phosphoglycerate kinase
MAISNEEREKRAGLYESYLRQHDALAREVSELQSKFDLSVADNAEIKKKQTEMLGIQRKSQQLGDYFG